MADEVAKFGFMGIALGAIALIMVLVHFWAGPFSPQPSLEKTVAEKAVAIRDATVAALKGKEIEDSSSRSPMTLDKAIGMAGAVLGGLAIILGVIGFARKEPLRVAGGAAVLGASAIAFQFMIVAIGAIIVAILVAAVISQLDFGLGG